MNKVVDSVDDSIHTGVSLYTARKKMTVTKQRRNIERN
jgi:hypothetical protein